MRRRSPTRLRRRRPARGRSRSGPDDAVEEPLRRRSRPIGAPQQGDEIAPRSSPTARAAVTAFRTPAGIEPLGADLPCRMSALVRSATAELRLAGEARSMLARVAAEAARSQRAGKRRASRCRACRCSFRLVARASRSTPTIADGHSRCDHADPVDRSTRAMPRASPRYRARGNALVRIGPRRDARLRCSRPPIWSARCSPVRAAHAARTHRTRRRGDYVSSREALRRGAGSTDERARVLRRWDRLRVGPGVDEQAEAGCRRSRMAEHRLASA